MICPKCGRRIPEYSVVCCECGDQFALAEQKEKVAETYQRTRKIFLDMFTSKTLLSLCIIMCIICLASALSMLSLFNGFIVVNPFRILSFAFSVVTLIACFRLYLQKSPQQNKGIIIRASTFPLLTKVICYILSIFFTITAAGMLMCFITSIAMPDNLTDFIGNYIDVDKVLEWIAEDLYETGEINRDLKILIEDRDLVSMFPVLFAVLTVIFALLTVVTVLCASGFKKSSDYHKTLAHSVTYNEYTCPDASEKSIHIAGIILSIFSGLYIAALVTLIILGYKGFGVETFATCLFYPALAAYLITSSKIIGKIHNDQVQCIEDRQDAVKKLTDVTLMTNTELKRLQREGHKMDADSNFKYEERDTDAEYYEDDEDDEDEDDEEE